MTKFLACLLTVAALLGAERSGFAAEEKASLLLRIVGDTIYEGEESQWVLTVRNNGFESIRLLKPTLAEDVELVLDVANDKGEKVPLEVHSDRVRVPNEGYEEIKKRQEMSFTLRDKAFNYAMWKKPGNYHIQVKYKVSADGNDLALTSNKAIQCVRLLRDDTVEAQEMGSKMLLGKKNLKYCIAKVAHVEFVGKHRLIASRITGDEWYQTSAREVYAGEVGHFGFVMGQKEMAHIVFEAKKGQETRVQFATVNLPAGKVIRTGTLDGDYLAKLKKLWDGQLTAQMEAEAAAADKAAVDKASVPPEAAKKPE